MTHTTVWRVPPWAWVPIGAAIVAEAVSNGLKAYSLGTHLERFTMTAWGYQVSIAGIVLVIGAVAVSLTQARAAWVAIRSNIPGWQRFFAILTAILLLGVSAVAMSGHLLEAQRTKVSDEGGARSAYDRAEAAYKAAQAELDRLGNPRPISVIQAEIKRFPIVDPLWARSKKCDEATKKDTQDYCDPLLRLRQEVGAAARKTQLAPQVEQLREALAAMPRPPEAATSENEIAVFWAWFFAGAIVLIATFGSVVWARVEVVEVTPEPKAQALTSMTASPPSLPEPTQSEPEPEPAPPGKPRKRKKGRKNEVKRIAKVVNFVQAHKAKHGVEPSFTVVRNRFRLPKSTASRLRSQAIRING